MIHFLKRNSCFVLFGLLVVIVLLVVSNAIHEGIGRIISQNQIDETYLVHK